MRGCRTAQRGYVFLWALFFGVFSWAARSSLTPASESRTLAVYPPQVPQGGLLLAVLREPGVDAPPVGEAAFLPQPVPFHRYRQLWVALVGVSYRTAPGRYTLSLRLPAGSEERSWTAEVEVLPRSFPVEELSLPPAQQTLRSPDRQKEDAARLQAARAASAPSPLWEGPFLLPVSGRFKTGFGAVRRVNGWETDRHSGLDIAAPAGTPVRAANAGIVRLAAHLNASGQTVLLDHGWGLTTSYSHLGRLLVREGQAVGKGEVIGEVGSTGVATGPHLHWAVSLHGVFVDPALLLAADPLAGLDQVQ
ncbi:MAG: M23 family metallopeptidase [Bacillota bacterium]|nr:M23 family metallopeptidase [Bacillota bacterium]